jgi:hypothetical protein
MTRLSIKVVYLWRHVSYTAPPFILWWWNLDICTTCPPQPQLSLHRRAALSSYSNRTRSYIAERTQSAVYIVRCLCSVPSPPPLTCHWHGIQGLKLSPLFWGIEIFNRNNEEAMHCHTAACLKIKCYKGSAGIRHFMDEIASPSWNKIILNHYCHIVCAISRATILFNLVTQDFVGSKKGAVQERNMIVMHGILFIATTCDGIQRGL